MAAVKSVTNYSHRVDHKLKKPRTDGASIKTGDVEWIKAWSLTEALLPVDVMFGLDLGRPRVHASTRIKILALLPAHVGARKRRKRSGVAQ